MPNISEEKTHKLVEIGAAALISLVFFLFSFTSPYRRLELLSLDARFNLRPPIVTNGDIATVDIDDRALEEEGRWQDWTRDRHARIIDIIRQGHGALLGFDVYFSEESERVLSPTDVARARSMEEVRAAFRDYDAELADAARKAGNVYWGATFRLDETEGAATSPEPADSGSSALARSNLAHLIEKGYCIPAENAGARTLLRATAPEAVPLPLLTEAARGVGFAQITRDADGVVRKYPTFIRYDHPTDADGQDACLFPSIGLAMACDYLQVHLKDLRIKPGAYVEIPNAILPDGTKKSLRVPIDEKGEMIINWAGDYKDSFRHYPYSSLIRLAEQRALEEIKKALSTQDPSIFRNPLEMNAVVRRALPDVRNSATYVAYVYGAHWYETLIENGEIDEFRPQLFEKLFGLSPEDSPGLYEIQKEAFENVRFNHAMLKLVSDRRGISMSEAASELGVPEQAAENSYMTIRQLLAKGGPTPADRPLFFLPPVILEGRLLSLDELRGGVFFYGLTATGTHDLNPMPFNPRYPMVGAVANVFNTIVTGQFISPLGDVWRLPLFLAIGLFTGYILSSRTTIRGSMFTLLFLVAYLLFAYWLFADRRIWIEVVGPTGIILLSDVTIVWYKFSTAEKKRKFIKSAFEHYMNPAVVDQIAANPDMLELGGKEMVLTAFFSDVAGFTTISEQLTPHQLVELLNEYLTAMTDIVLKYDGLLDKYEGDAIMAVFGAPIHFPDHATKACYAALEMQDRLREMRAKWKIEGRPELKARIGLNTGAMIVGNMGSLTRFDYTVMGDSVNLASRLEGVNKQYSTDIMISQFTLELCKPDVVVREVDLIRVKGKTEPVTIYEVLARANDGLPEDVTSVVEHYSLGLQAYRQRKWETGIGEFRRALEIRPDDGPSLTYLKRCSEYLSAPPPDDWDGVYIMTTK